MSEKILKEQLIISVQSYIEKLNERISIGNEILKTYEPLPDDCYYYYTEPFMGGRRYRKREDYPERQKKFMDDYDKWNNFNSELLKHSFDIPNNSYHSSYNSSDISLLLSKKDRAEICKLALENKIKLLEQFIDAATLLPCAVNDKKPIKEQNISDKRKVFIVHGHDDDLRTKVELLLRELNLEPIVLFKAPNAGRTIIEKIEEESNDIAFAIVLYYPCDLGNDKNAVNDLSDLKPRARQNVVFEHGYMCSLLGRNRVCAVCTNDIEIPGDLSGILYLKADDSDLWRYKLVKEMNAAGMSLDMNLIK